MRQERQSSRLTAYLLQAGVVGLERLGKPKVLTLNNELEITQTKKKEKKKSATLFEKEYRR